ncbi:MAG: DUF1926 domain-containing protein, partial [Candidatus Eisenbacteria bacterium]|nr:DUF1926 domain-containing protein [Candidatus Eisenbacteria bacterium]
ILPSIPSEDRIAQIKKLNDWVKKKFKLTPQGIWLTERVWEPGLVQDVAAANIEYTMVDDSHFLSAGIPQDQLWGSYLTEDQGVPLRVYPISKALRYLIPFEPPEKTIDFLRGIAAEGENRVALIGDDGEKFGVWPNTHELVYKQGWLKKFFELLVENQDWLKLRFPSEGLREKPLGKVYLPTASYTEMMEWSLPAEEQTSFHHLRNEVESQNVDHAKFVQGGFWRNFFSRYPESDHINKRMLMLRRECKSYNNGQTEEAKDLLLAAQCNCAYWHGVFGGLYLPHLRDALYERILRAEKSLDALRYENGDWVETKQHDFDCDGDNEVFLRNSKLTLVLSPNEGGSIQELSYKPLAVALSNGLTRRAEAYHTKVSQAVLKEVAEAQPKESEDGSVASIHDLVLAKEEGLESLLHYDTYRRTSLIDHFFRKDTSAKSFHQGTYGELGDFRDNAYEVATVAKPGWAILSLRRQGTVWAEGEPHNVMLEKRLRLNADQSHLTIDYTLENMGDSKLKTWFGVEFNFGLLAPDSPTHRYRMTDGSDQPFNYFGEDKDQKKITLEDSWRGFAVQLDWERPAGLWRVPVETVSMSEEGFERIYQASSVVPHWKVELKPKGMWSMQFELKVTPTKDP